MSTAEVHLEVIVVGGGICGLSCAIVRRAGHDVIVYEKYPEVEDAGAGIVLGAWTSNPWERSGTKRA